MPPAEFFVVGGPVQPERPCYVERDADLKLEDALRAKRLCCVLGPFATGKSSLLHRAARTLRKAGTLVAIVELKRIVEQGSHRALLALGGEYATLYAHQFRREAESFAVQKAAPLLG